MIAMAIVPISPKPLAQVIMYLIYILSIERYDDNDDQKHCMTQQIWDIIEAQNIRHWEKGTSALVTIACLCFI